MNDSVAYKLYCLQFPMFQTFVLLKNTKLFARSYLAWPGIYFEQCADFPYHKSSILPVKTIRDRGQSTVWGGV